MHGMVQVTNLLHYSLVSVTCDEYTRLRSLLLLLNDVPSGSSSNKSFLTLSLSKHATDIFYL